MSGVSAANSSPVDTVAEEGSQKSVSRSIRGTMASSCEGEVTARSLIAALCYNGIAAPEQWSQSNMENNARIIHRQL